jgi:hypothetical protein
MSLRFDQRELDFESPRLLKWEPRIRRLLIAALAHAVLLSLQAFDDPIQPLIQHRCHRTGQWSLKVKAPLDRLRAVLSRLWVAHPPPFNPEISFGVSHVPSPGATSTNVL